MNAGSAKSQWKGLRHFNFVLFSALFLIVSSMYLGGCSGGSEDSGTSGGDTGEVVIGLTDAQGDFLTYTVHVLSLTLTKKNGAVVDTLPLETRVDFAQYTEMTEFLTAATVPSGVYVKAVMTLDYRDADIQVEDVNGSGVQVETILDEDGNELSILEVAVHLEDRNQLLIAPGIPAHLTLDFDLKASNWVEFDNGVPTVTVEPVLLADVNPEDPKIHRLRGPLKDVDVNNGSFEVFIRPFIHVISGGNSPFGVLEVVTDAETVYEINGENYQGIDGLTALDEQQVLTAVIVMGDLNIKQRRFEATQVYAGSSVPGGTLDVVSGNVISRSDDELTVKGATLIRGDGSVIFNDEIVVLLGENTTVSRQLSMDSFEIDDISVGQRITVFGKLNEDETRLNANFDDEDGHGHVRMHLTTLKGDAVATEEGALFIDLKAINGRRVGQFDFTGTGSDPDNDADPQNYDIDTGALDLNGMAAGAPVKVRGFVTPFGHMPEEADFSATTVVNVSAVKGLMFVSWLPASTAAIEDLSKDGFTMNLAGVGFFHHVKRAGVLTDLTDLAQNPVIEPDDDGEGLFSIVQDGSSQLFFEFDGFSEELAQRLAENTAVKRITATGTFDDATANMTTNWVMVKLNPKVE
jgi:hypothetical protein